MMYLAWFYWDVKRELLALPFVDIPIYVYSLLFACGFIGGYFLFRKIAAFFFLRYYPLYEGDIQDKTSLLLHLKSSLLSPFFSRLSTWEKAVERLKTEEGQKELRALFIEKNIFPQSFFEKKYPDPVATALRLFAEKISKNSFLLLRYKATKFADLVVIYTILATVIGARLGHFLFYEKPMHYLTQPWVLLQTWKGGLASHGAAIAIFISLLFFSARKMKHFAHSLHFFNLLDMVAIPTAFAAVFIRVGNFFNQEILGMPTTKPWGVIFAHPFDHSAVLPRHPVQLYEALFYLFTFFFLSVLAMRTKILEKKGKMIGVFFLLVFGFRFFIESLKGEQSYLFAEGSFLLMGQLLSVPFILLGLFFLFQRRLFSSKRF